MSSITTASSAAAFEEKRRLARSVLYDIDTVVAYAASELMACVRRSVLALDRRLAELPNEDIGLVVGPELYRVLGDSAWNLRQGNTIAARAELKRLPLTLLGRLIAAGPPAGGAAVDVPAGPRGARIPQMESFLELPRRTPYARLEVSDTALKCDGGVVAPMRDLQARIDGASRDGAPWLDDTQIYFHQRGDHLVEMLAELSDTASQPVGKDEGLGRLDLTSASSQVIRANMAEGARLLRRASPEQFDEVSAVMDGITLSRGRLFVGGSDIWYHGIAVLNPDEEWSSTTYADHLVHEGAHLRLHTYNELQPVLRNPDSLEAPSPIREDRRPLYGTLHATFVFMRLVMFFNQVQRERRTDEVQFRLHRHLLGFYEGMDAIERYAQPTVSGREFLQDMVRLRRQFERELPVPDPRYYLRIGKDYVV